MSSYDPRKPADAIAALGRGRMCVTCRHWRPDVIAHPHLDAPGSQRRCARGHVSSAGQWCREWEALTPAKAIEAANAEGRLF